MITITANIPNKMEQTVIFWRIGQKVEQYSYAGGPVTSNEIISIDAYGPELQFIKETIVNLQYPKFVDSVKWYGEAAKLIFQCLPR